MNVFRVIRFWKIILGCTKTKDIKSDLIVVE